MNASTFDPVKSAREELTALNEIQRVLIRRERICEEAMAIAESDLDAVRKIAGYIRISIDTMQQRISELEKASEN